MGKEKYWKPFFQISHSGQRTLYSWFPVVEKGFACCLDFPIHIQIQVGMEETELKKGIFPCSYQRLWICESQSYLNSYTDPKANLPDISAPISIPLAPCLHHKARNKIPAAKSPSYVQEYSSEMLMLPEQLSRHGSRSWSRLLVC